MPHSLRIAHGAQFLSAILFGTGRYQSEKLNQESLLWGRAPILLEHRISILMTDVPSMGPSTLFMQDAPLRTIPS